MIGRLFRILGIVLLAAGLMFLLQGAGLLHWPRESFMIGRQAWIWIGLGIAIAGAGLLFRSRHF